LQTQVSWKITIKNNRGARHELEIKIFDYGKPESPDQTPDQPFSERIILPSSLEISNFQSTSYGKALIWADNLTIEVSQITKGLSGSFPNPLIIHCNFDEDEIISNYDDFSVISIFHNCRDLNASLIDVQIRLPKPAFLRYYLDLILVKIFKWTYLLKFYGMKEIVGMYNVGKAEGPDAQDWDVLDDGREPVLKFKNPKGTISFPNINFYYSRAAKPLQLTLGAGLSFMFFHWAISRFLQWIAGGH